jgi:hypothetical protein
MWKDIVNTKVLLQSYFEYIMDNSLRSLIGSRLDLAIRSDQIRSDQRTVILIYHEELSDPVRIDEFLTGETDLCRQWGTS